MKAIYLDYLEEIKPIPVLDVEENDTLASKASEDQEAFQKVIRHNLKLVVYYAAPYFKGHTAHEIMDIITAGNDGLIQSISTYDKEKGHFFTHAYLPIHQTIRNELKLLDCPVTLTESAHACFYKLQKENQNRTTPMELEEIRKQFKVGEKVGSALLALDTYEFLSLEKDVYKSQNIPDYSNTLEEVEERLSLPFLLATIKSNLSSYEYYIFYSRVVNRKTESEIASEFHCSTNAIANVEKEIRRKVSSCATREFYPKEYLYKIKDQLHDFIPVEPMEKINAIFSKYASLYDEKDASQFGEIIKNEYGKNILDIDEENDFEIEKLNAFFTVLNTFDYDTLYRQHYAFFRNMHRYDQVRVMEYLFQPITTPLTLLSSKESRSGWSWPKIHKLYHLLEPLQLVEPLKKRF